MTLVSNDSKWYFWLDRWKDVFRHSTDEVTLNLVPRSVIINKTLATIMAILIHDCVYKETFSWTLISFRAWKPVEIRQIPIAWALGKIHFGNRWKFLKLFYFSRYKPTGLQMTPVQILIPLTGMGKYKLKGWKGLFQQ